MVERRHTLLAQVFARAVDVKRQHPHAGARTIGRDFFREQGISDGLRVLIEEFMLRVSGVGGDSSRPFVWGFLCGFLCWHGFSFAHLDARSHAERLSFGAHERNSSASSRTLPRADRRRPQRDGLAVDD